MLATPPRYQPALLSAQRACRLYCWCFFEKRRGKSKGKGSKGNNVERSREETEGEKETDGGASKGGGGGVDSSVATDEQGTSAAAGLEARRKSQEPEVKSRETDTESSLESGEPLSHERSFGILGKYSSHTKPKSSIHETERAAGINPPPTFKQRDLVFPRSKTAFSACLPGLRNRRERCRSKAQTKIKDHHTPSHSLQYQLVCRNTRPRQQDIPLECEHVVGCEHRQVTPLHEWRTPYFVQAAKHCEAECDCVPTEVAGGAAQDKEDCGSGLVKILKASVVTTKKTTSTGMMGRRSVDMCPRGQGASKLCGKHRAENDPNQLIVGLPLCNPDVVLFTLPSGHGRMFTCTREVRCQGRALVKASEQTKGELLAACSHCECPGSSVPTAMGPKQKSQLVKVHWSKKRDESSRLKEVNNRQLDGKKSERRGNDRRSEEKIEQDNESRRQNEVALKDDDERESQGDDHKRNDSKSRSEEEQEEQLAKNAEQGRIEAKSQSDLQEQEQDVEDPANDNKISSRGQRLSLPLKKWVSNPNWELDCSRDTMVQDSVLWDIHRQARCWDIVYCRQDQIIMNFWRSQPVSDCIKACRCRYVPGKDEQQDVDLAIKESDRSGDAERITGVGPRTEDTERNIQPRGQDLSSVFSSKTKVKDSAMPKASKKHSNPFTQFLEGLAPLSDRRPIPLIPEPQQFRGNGYLRCKTKRTRVKRSDRWLDHIRCKDWVQCSNGNIVKKMEATPNEYFQACKDDCQCKRSSFDLLFVKRSGGKGKRGSKDEQRTGLNGWASRPPSKEFFRAAEGKSVLLPISRSSSEDSFHTPEGSNVQARDEKAGANMGLQMNLDEANLQPRGGARSKVDESKVWIVRPKNFIVLGCRDDGIVSPSKRQWLKVECFDAMRCVEKQIRPVSIRVPLWAQNRCRSICRCLDERELGTGKSSRQRSWSQWEAVRQPGGIGDASEKVSKRRELQRRGSSYSTSKAKSKSRRAKQDEAARQAQLFRGKFGTEVAENLLCRVDIVASAYKSPRYAASCNTVVFCYQGKVTAFPSADGSMVVQCRAACICRRAEHERRSIKQNRCSCTKANDELAGIGVEAKNRSLSTNSSSLEVHALSKL